MIFIALTRQQKNKYRKYIFLAGLLFLILGFIPGFLSYKAGIILFIFSLVSIGVLETAISEPDPADLDPVSTEETSGPVDKILKG